MLAHPANHYPTSDIEVIFSALGTIFRTGAYIYATTGKAPSSMDPALLQAAFRKK